MGLASYWYLLWYLLEAHGLLPCSGDCVPHLNEVGREIRTMREVFINDLLLLCMLFLGKISCPALAIFFLQLNRSQRV